MFVFIASVHHTGTQFAQKLFEDFDYLGTDKKPAESGNSRNYFHRCHISDSIKTELTEWLELGLPLVVPLRHPVEVAKSWKARDKSLKIMLRQWQLLEELVLPYQPYFLPVDHDYRDVYFQVIKEAINPEIMTDWQIVGSKREGSGHKSNLTVPDFTADDICNIQPLADMCWLTEIYPEPWLLNGETAQ